MPSPVRARCVRLRSRTVILTAVLALLFAGDVAAQAPSEGRLQGRVLDASGLPLPGALVELSERDRRFSATTGSDGQYTIAQVPPGRYVLRFSMVSFVTVVRRDIAITAGATVSEDASLLVAATTSVVVSGRRTFRELSTVSTQDELVGVADAASTGVVTPSELNERARRRPAEAPESVPGLVVSQHSGEGKGNQYYLRGFNIDHGTDLSLSLAGMPVNLPSHGHGQGYADMNFMIPELVSGIQYRTCLRTLLGVVTGTDPGAIRFGYTSHGRPYLQEPLLDIRFNLAHSGDDALIGMTRSIDIGVDIERVTALSN
jgi:hypothetical protein